MNTSRTKRMAKNVILSLLLQIVGIAISFIERKAFVSFLNIDLLGLNNLLNEIINVISLAELGMGAAIVYSLYKPIADNDEEMIKKYLRYFLKLYNYICLTIGALGLLLLPFINLIVGAKSAGLQISVPLIYLLFLANTLLSYVFIYKSSLLIADQSKYIISLWTQVFRFVSAAVHIAILIFTRNYYLYLGSTCFFTLLANLVISFACDRKYPYIKRPTQGEIDPQEKKAITINIKSLFIYRIGSVFLGSSDNIIANAILGLKQVGLYANYSMITIAFSGIIDQVMNAYLSSIGSLNTTKDHKKVNSIFSLTLFLCAWGIGFVTSAMYLFFNDFITLFFGANYILGYGTVLAICCAFYVTQLHYPLYIFRNTTGLFVYGKSMPIIAAVINIVLSIGLGKLYGLAGIFFATVIARLLTYEVIDTYYVYKKVLVRKISDYFIRYGKYLLIAVVVTAIAYWLKGYVDIHNFGSFLLVAVGYTLFFNLFYAALFWKTNEMRDLKNYIMVLRKRKQT